MILQSQSEKFFIKSQEIVPGGVHSPVRSFHGVGGVPPFMEWARGAEMRDVDGNHYIDYCMSWGPLIFGHQDPETLEAVQGALKRGWTYGTAEPYSLDLAELITSSLPWVQKIRFVNSGTEAVMAALRLARAATGRNKIVKFDGCYHGHVDSMLVRAGSGLAEMASPDSAGVTRSVAGDTIVVPLNDLEQIEKVFEIHGKEIAALIVEPIPANNGLLLQEDRFLGRITELARSFKSLVIFDEVITGFRVAFGGMAEKSGIRPDLVTYGKIIGGGFPVGAYGGRADLMDWISPAGPVYQAGTLSANPIAMTAGFTTLKKLKHENPYASLQKETEHFKMLIENLGQKLDFPIRVQSYGSIFWMILGAIQTVDGFVRTAGSTPAEHKANYASLFHSLLQSGIYLAPSAFEVSFLSTAHSPDCQQKMVTALQTAIQKVRYEKNPR